MTPDQFRDVARTSSKVLQGMGPDIQWVQSCVAGGQDPLRLQRTQRSAPQGARPALGLPCQPHDAGGCSDRSGHGSWVALMRESALALPDNDTIKLAERRPRSRRVGGLGHRCADLHGVRSDP
jgi:hypothetical protein